MPRRFQADGRKYFLVLHQIFYNEYSSNEFGNDRRIETLGHNRSK